MLKTVVLLNIFVETDTFFLIILESSNILTDIFDSFNASVLSLN